MKKPILPVVLELIAVYGVSAMLNAVMAAISGHEYFRETAILVTLGWYVIKHRL